MDNSGPSTTAPTENNLAGCLHSVAAHSILDGVTVWFAYRPVGGDNVAVEAITNADGEFAFDLPDRPLERAAIGAHLEGVEPVDLRPDGQPLEPGDVVLMVNDIVPSHLRFGGA